MKLVVGLIIIIWLSTGGAIEGKYLGKTSDGFYKIKEYQILSSDLQSKYPCENRTVYIPEKNIIKIEKLNERVETREQRVAWIENHTVAEIEAKYGGWRNEIFCKRLLASPSYLRRSHLGNVDRLSIIHRG